MTTGGAGVREPAAGRSPGRGVAGRAVAGAGVRAARDGVGLTGGAVGWAVASTATGLGGATDGGGSDAGLDPSGHVAAKAATDSPTTMTALMATPATNRSACRPPGRTRRPAGADS